MPPARILFFMQASLDHTPPKFGFLLVGMTGVHTTMLSFFLLRWETHELFAQADLDYDTPSELLVANF
jgi:hypothetical protein